MAVLKTFMLLIVLCFFHGAGAMFEDDSDHESLGKNAIEMTTFTSNSPNFNVADTDVPLDFILFLDAIRPHHPYLQQACTTRAIGSLTWADIGEVLKDIPLGAGQNAFGKQEIPLWNALLNRCPGIKKVSLRLDVAYNTDTIRLPHTVKHLHLIDISLENVVFPGGITHLSLAEITPPRNSMEKILGQLPHLVHFEYLNPRSKEPFGFPKGNRIETFYYEGRMDMVDFQNLLGSAQALRNLRATQNYLDIIVYDLCPQLEQAGLLDHLRQLGLPPWD